MTNVLGEELGTRRSVVHRRGAEGPAHRARRGGNRVFPSIIISADDKQLMVRAEVPGMRLDDFEISVSGDLLTIYGSRPTGQGLSGGWYHRRERENGEFSRSVRLPANVDGEKAEASYVAGVLTITLPLMEPAKPRHVPVQVTG
jgi:HSP20 family protein